MILMIPTWSLRKILKKSLRRILRKNMKRTLKKSWRRLQRWRGSYERELVVENIKLRELKEDEISNTLLRMGQERTERELYHLRAWTYDFYEEMVQAGVVGVRPDEAIDVTMLPRRLKRRAIEIMMQKRVAEAIAEYKRNQTNPKNARGSGPANTGGVVASNVHGCSYKTFRNCQPHSFNGTEGVFGLTHWFEKMEQVFEISKCAKEDKVKFVACTFEATEIQKIEKELWTLTVKGDDIEEYYNRLHELALMCPNMVTPKKNKIECYIRGLPKKVKQNKRRKAAKAYVAAPAEGKVHLGNLPLCNRCKLHHHDQCSVKCKKFKRIGHQTKDCWSKTSAVDTPPTADANA
nr:hypothetical protein [Tanacetum cinerariifolium]